MIFLHIYISVNFDHYTIHCELHFPQPFLVYRSKGLFTWKPGWPGKQDSSVRSRCVVNFIVKIIVHLYGQAGWPGCQDLA